MNKCTKKHWSESVYIHAEIDSHFPPTEPGDWALEISGSILVTDEVQGRVCHASETEIGTMRAFLIQVREARRQGLQAFTVLKAKCFATSEYTQLFDKAEWRKRVRKKFDPRSADLLILDRIELQPEYRGQGVGLLAVRCVIEMFGLRCGLVACKPYPLQFEGSNKWTPPAQVSGTTKSLREARRKLRRYWACAGFKRVPGTMLYALEPQRNLPTIARMLRAKGK
jgi:GNAT superfamily N-acetyltransferase